MGKHVYNKSKTHGTDAKKGNTNYYRIALSCPYWTFDEKNSREEFKLLNISSINKYGRALFSYKYVNSQLPGTFDNYFINNHQFRDYDTRSREDMCIPNSRLDIRKQTIRNAGPALWNSRIMEFPSTLRMLRPSNYLNEAWNHIYYLLRCSHIKWPCSTSCKLKNCIDSTVTVQKTPTFSSYASYGGNIIFLCTINPFCCHWSTYVQEQKFFPRVVDKPHTVSTSLCLMYMILLLPCCLWCLYFRQ